MKITPKLKKLVEALIEKAGAATIITEYSSGHEEEEAAAVEVDEAKQALYKHIQRKKS